MYKYQTIVISLHSTLHQPILSVRAVTTDTVPITNKLTNISVHIFRLLFYNKILKQLSAFVLFCFFYLKREQSLENGSYIIVINFILHVTRESKKRLGTGVIAKKSKSACTSLI